jgi:hypothetical protein
MKKIKYVLCVMLMGWGVNSLADKFEYRICMTAPEKLADKLPRSFYFKVVNSTKYILDKANQEDLLTLSTPNTRYCTKPFIWETEGHSCESHPISKEDGEIQFEVLLASKNNASASPWELQSVKTSTSGNNLGYPNTPVIYLRGDLFFDPNTKIGVSPSGAGLGKGYMPIEMQTFYKYNCDEDFPSLCQKAACNPRHNFDIDLVLNDTWIK